MFDMKKVFVCYAGADKVKVQRLAGELQKAGYKIVDPGGVPRSGLEVETSIGASDYFLLFVSSKSIKSADIRRELDQAYQNARVVIPVLLENVKIPVKWSLPLAGVHQIRMGGVQWRSQLLSALGTNQKKKRSKPKPPSVPRKAASTSRDGKIYKTPKMKTGKRAERPAKEDVHFTAIHPKEGVAEKWHSLLVYIHTQAALDHVRTDARRFSDELMNPKESSSRSDTRLARGTAITIVPHCDGLVFNPERITIKWLEDYQRMEFRFRADKSFQGDAARGEVAFYVGPVIIGTLRLAMLFGGKVDAPAQEEQGQMYRQDAIFISYSRKDTDIVNEFKKVHEATGFDVLLDIDDIRSGEKWNPKLLQMIDKADIFQLFWSPNSEKSKYCKQEWQYALKRSKEGFIRPVYWKKPMPEPPKELGMYHFHYEDFLCGSG